LSQKKSGKFYRLSRYRKSNIPIFNVYLVSKSMVMKKHRMIGLMSGTSLDGLDIAYVEFSFHQDSFWEFDLLCFSTYEYNDSLVERLKKSTEVPASQLFQLDVELAKIWGDFVLGFISKHEINQHEITAIASHGHTVFHRPELGYTTQIGCGTTLAHKTGIKVINDFRTRDVVHGGQGAPLVPIGDFELFKNKAAAYLNIGGISNLSFKKNNKIIAYDCCPGNLPLNKLAKNVGLKFDKNGDLARQGDINFFLLDLLNDIEYYKSDAPKSIGIEWLETYFYPLIKFGKETENNLRTILEHIAYQIALNLNSNKIKSVLVSGGGAKNTFLIERISHYFDGEVIVPEEKIIDFKEAVIFAFLGVLFLENQANCLSSVTGATKDVCGGVLHLV
jgi:anhydro-N-acetylmuramic acid kinase